jgi:hypothetical protein
MIVTFCVSEREQSSASNSNGMHGSSPSHTKRAHTRMRFGLAPTFNSSFGWRQIKPLFNGNGLLLGDLERVMGEVVGVVVLV